MANVQCENGYTKIANELLEAIVKARFAGNVVGLLLFLIRESYGWKGRGNETLAMGTRAMEKKTGIQRSSIQLALNVLIEAGVIEKGNVGWVINKDYETWKPTGQSTGPRPAHRPTSGQSAVPPPASGLTTYKDKAISKDKERKQIAQTTAPESGLEHKKPLTGIQKVMRGFKEAKGIDADDTGWDTLHFKRFARAAADLLKVFKGDADAAIVYTLKKGDELDKKQLSGWGLEAVARAAATDLKVLNYLTGEHGSEHQPVEHDSQTRPRSNRRYSSSGSLAGDALRSIEQTSVPTEEVGRLGSDDPDFAGDPD